MQGAGRMKPAQGRVRTLLGRRKGPQVGRAVRYWATTAFAVIICPLLTAGGCSQRAPVVGPAPGAQRVPPQAAGALNQKPATPFEVSDDDSWLLASPRAPEATQHRLVLVDLRNAAAREIELPGRMCAFIPKDWDAEGRQVVGVWSTADHSDGGIAVLEVDAGAVAELTNRIAGASADWWPKWSPSGRWIAFERGESPQVLSLLLIPAEGGEAQRVHEAGTTISPSRHGGYSWDAERDRLYFTARPEAGDETTLYVAEVGATGGSELRRVFLPSVPRLLATVRVISSPADGHAVIELRNVEGGARSWDDMRSWQSVWLVDLSRHEPARLVAESRAKESYVPLRFTDERHLLALRRAGEAGGESALRGHLASQLVTIDAATGESTELPLPQADFDLPKVSASGKFFYWSNREDGSVRRTAVDEWQPELVYSPNGRNGSR